IDTGIDGSHPDLAGNMWVNPGEDGTAPGGADKRSNGIDDDGNGFVDDWRGWDFVNGDNDPHDDHSHGTHCAGTIGAIGANGVGVAGVCWQVSLVGLKFLDAGGGGSTSGAIAAVAYANTLGLDLTSNSWGGGGYSAELEAAIEAGLPAGRLFVAAAGNSGMDIDASPSYPAGYDSPNIVSVAATDHADAIAYFSNYGLAGVDLGAPGVSVYSTTPGAGYQHFSGTSMACPHVAGALALMRSVSSSPGAVLKQALLDEVDAIPALSGKCVSHGRLNLARSLAVVAGPHLVRHALTVDDATLGNGDGLINPGETVVVRLAARNTGGDPALSVDGALVATGGDPALVLVDPLSAYGDIAPGSVADGDGYAFSVAAGTATPHAIALRIDLTDGAGATWSFPLDLVAHTSSTIAGAVRAATGGAAIAGAVVTALGAEHAIDAVSGADGGFTLTVPDGSWQVGASAAGYNDSATLAVAAPPGASGVILLLGHADIVVEPPSLALIADQGGSDDAPLLVRNIGDAPLTVAITATSAEWIADGLWHRCDRGRTDDDAWYYGREDTRKFDTGGRNRGELISDQVVVPLADPTLALWYRRQTEGGTTYDISQVAVSNDGGASWSTVGAFYDSTNTWVPVSIPLSAWAGQSVRIRFLFDTLDSIGNAYEGWYVDDVLLGGAPLAGGWLTAAPDALTVPAGDERTVMVSASAAGRAPGTYTANLLIASNDVDQPLTPVPVTFQVVGSPALIGDGLWVTDAAPGGDADGFAEPGETVAVFARLRNVGSEDAVAIAGAMTSADDQVAIGDASAAYGTILVGASADGDGFALTIAPACPVGHTVVATIIASDGVGRSWTIPLALTVDRRSRLSGIVTGVGAAPLASAWVAIAGLWTTTASDGSYAISGIPDGAWSASISAPSYRTSSASITTPPDAIWSPELGRAEISVAPASLIADVQRGGSAALPLSIGNLGNVDLDWSIAVEGLADGYAISHSDEVGAPPHEWLDIRDTGTPFDPMYDDTNRGPYPIGFTFPFYGDSFSTYRICSNGWLSFTSHAYNYWTMPLPSLMAPENLIAFAWADLNFTSGTAHRQSFADRLVVQFTDVPLYHHAAARLTCQAILRADGSITFAYHRVDRPQAFTVGVQDATMTHGATVTHASTLLHAGWSVHLRPSAGWLSVAPQAGTTVGGGTSLVMAQFAPGTLALGSHVAELRVASDDDDTPEMVVPVTMRIHSAHVPIAAPGTASGIEDQPLAIALQASDADGDALTYRVVVPPAHGAVTITGAQALFVPTADWNGSDSFAFAASDGGDESAPAEIALTIAPANDAPVATPQWCSTPAGQALHLTLSGSDIDGDGLTFRVVTLPAHGMLIGDPPALTYLAEAGFTGPDAVAFVVSDGELESPAASVAFEVYAPVVEDAAAWPQLGNGPQHRGYAPVRLGDADLLGAWSHGYYGQMATVIGDGAAFTAEQYGLVRQLAMATGEVKWTLPLSGYQLTGLALAGDRLLVHEMSYPSQLHGIAFSAAPSVAWSVPTGWYAVGNPMVAGGDVVLATPYEVLVRSAADGTGGFTAPLLEARGTPAARGDVIFTVGLGGFTVLESRTGAVRWSVPLPGEWYNVEVGGVVVDGDRAFVVVRGFVDRLHAIDLVGRGVAWTHVGRYAGMPAAVDGLVHVISPDAGVLSYRAADGAPTRWYRAPIQAPTITAQPLVTHDAILASGYYQTWRFRLGQDDPVQVLPAGGALAIGGGKLLVSGYGGVMAFALPAQPPSLRAQHVAVLEDHAVAIALHADSGDGDPTTWSVIEGPSHGILLGTAPTLTYIPSADYHGPDAFTVRVSDDDGADEGVIVIDVLPVNDAPHAADRIAVASVSGATVVLSGHDVDGDALVARILTPPTAGTLTGTPPTLYWSVPLEEAGATFTYVVNDGHVDSAPATVTLTEGPLTSPSPRSEDGGDGGGGCGSGGGGAIAALGVALSLLRLRGGKRR
ncbi:MAG TPA: Ig-like domain-containing protein, partial [Planctomycetota bacterium]|nr:Ig-like domain-containing protein [Planctomycetota bacterium]